MVGNVPCAPGKELLTLRGHSGDVDSVAFSPDGKRLATASWDHTAKVWEAESGKEPLTLRGHSDFVLGVVFSPDGKHLATASEDGTVRSTRSTHANYSSWLEAVSPAPSLPTSANATSSPQPARPYANLGV